MNFSNLRGCASGTILLASLLGFPVVAASAPQRTVELRFAGEIGARPFHCGESYDGVGSPAATIRPTDFRFYLQDVALVEDSGKRVPIQITADGVWQSADVAMIDFENGTGPCRSGNAGTNSKVVGRVPEGRYSGVEFTVGVPAEQNHRDASVAESPLNFTAMFWAWRSGYRFFKVDLEGNFPMKRPGMQTGFNVHVGSTMCGKGAMTEPPTEACRAPNRVHVRLSDFDIDKDVVTVDLGAVFVGTDISRNVPETAPGCMSAPDDPDCAGVFAAFGLPFGGKPAGEQTVFRKR